LASVILALTFPVWAKVLAEKKDNANTLKSERKMGCRNVLFLVIAVSYYE
jgi:hypothetical protein